MPELAPDSVEVVELARGKAYVVVRARNADVLVLDRLGRVVRSRQRLAAIGRHICAVQQVGRAFEEARLPQRAEQAEQSIALLGKLMAARPAKATILQGVTGSLVALREALQLAHMQAQRWKEAPPTERTLRRSVLLLNDAAVADRAVVRALRQLGAELRPDSSDPPSDKLRRWVLARLSAPDVPFFMHELAAADQSRYASWFAKISRG